MTIWACQAGKDVYVEKPCSHNVHEGRIAVEAARKYNRIVQHGTQSRSDSALGRGRRTAIKSGQLGKLLVSRALCYKPRESRSASSRTPTPPANLDFDIWLGPAPAQPYHANLVHYNWHWFWDFGNGDIGNQGVHQMDIARWLHPRRRDLAQDRAQPRRPVRLQRPGPDAQHPGHRHGLRRHPAHLRGPRAQDRRLTTARRSATSPISRRGSIAGRQVLLPRGRPRRCRSPKWPRSTSIAARARAISATSSRPSGAARPRPQRRHPRRPLLRGPLPPGQHLLPPRRRRSRSASRPRPSATTRTPTRRSSGWKSTSRTTGRPRRPGLSTRPQAHLRRGDRVIRRRPRGQPTPHPTLPQAVRRARTDRLIRGPAEADIDASPADLDPGRRCISRRDDSLTPAAAFARTPRR